MPQKQETSHSWLGRSLGNCKVSRYVGEHPLFSLVDCRFTEAGKALTGKILKPSPSLDYFLARSKKIATLDHPYIVPIYDSGFADEIDRYYIVAESYTTDLAQLLQKHGAYTLENALPVFLQLAQVLVYAHTQGVAHGSLSPENLLVDEAQDIKSDNWGLVYAHVLLPGSKPIFGTPGYMAPEQFSGVLPNYSTDIYNLGCTFYQLLTNKIPFAEEQNIARLKGTAYRLPALPPLPDMPEAAVSLLRAMLANEPEKRLSKASDLVTSLEGLMAVFYRATCPRCGKKNTAQEVFQCKVCSTFNLCLSHLVVEENKCDQCVSLAKAMVTQQVVKPSAQNRGKLSEFLHHLAHNGKAGILVLGSRHATLALNIKKEYLEICLEKTSSDQIYKRFGTASPVAEQLPALHTRIVKSYLTQLLEWKEFAFEFWENATLEKVVPQNKTRFGFATQTTEFLSSFACLLKLLNDMMTPGGIALHSGNKSLALLFGDKGIVAVSPATGNKDSKTLRNHVEIETLLKEVFVPGCSSLQYRTAITFPAAGVSSMPSQNPFVLEALSNCEWECSEFVIPLDRLLPPTERWEAPFGGMELSQLSQLVRQKIMAALNPAKLQKLFGISSLHAFLFTAAVAKQKLAEVGQMLVEMVENHTQNWGEAKSEQLLLEAQKLCPDTAVIPDHLAEIYSMRNEYKKMAASLAQAGDIYWQGNELKAALPCYEKAVQLDAQPLEPRLRLMQLYTNGEPKDLTAEIREKVETIGNGIISALQQQKHPPLDSLEKLCLGMLKVNNNLIACHRELIKLYLGRNDRPAAIATYETLAKIFMQDKNRDAATHCYATILKLDSKRSDMQEKLKKMGHDKWQPLVEKVQVYKPQLEIKLDAQQLKLAIRIGSAMVVVVLIFVAWLIFFADSSSSQPIEQPVQPTENTAVRARRELKEKWETSKELIVLVQKAGDWQKASELCKTTIKEFARTSFAKESETFCNNVLAEIVKASEQEMAALWRQMETACSQNKKAQAEDICAQIIAKGDGAWQEKARKAVEEMRQQVIQKKERQILQQKTYDEAVRLQRLGNWREAFVLYGEAEKLDAQSPLASSAKGARQWLQEMEQQAKQLYAEAENYEREQKYSDAVMSYQRILADTNLRYTNIAQNIMLPLVIETEPVSAKCLAMRQELGETPLVYRYRPPQMPEIVVKRAGFNEVSRSFSRATNDCVWKLTISLQYKPLWVVQTGGPIESPLVQDGNVFYVGSRDGYMYAITKDGKKKWSFHAGLLADISGGVTFDDSQVYFGSYRGEIYGLDKNNGKARWKQSVGAAVRTTPCWAGTHICFANENSILSFVTPQGQIAWQLNLQDKCYTSPVAWERKVVFVATGQKLFAISVAKRQALWQQTLKGQLRSGPLIEQKHIYYTTSSNQVCKISLAGQKAWETTLPSILCEALYISANQVLVGDKNGLVYCLDNNSGKVLWQKDTATISGSGAITPAIIETGKMVLAANMAHRFVVMAKDNGNIVWEYEFPDAFSSQALFSQGVLYVGSDKGQIYACPLEDVVK
jgi:serine/threonine protein kinase/outer membrane protein assembly factor BamB/tetratricopeptide (TPR) repeat protein